MVILLSLGQFRSQSEVWHLGVKMKITTKYNTGDKVWFYIEELNKYAWGKVESMDITVRCGKVDVVKYNIENRFYEKNMWLGFTPYGMKRDFRLDTFVSFKEQEVFENVEQVKRHLNGLHKDKMVDLKELKKGWFK